MTMTTIPERIFATRLYQKTLEGDVPAAFAVHCRDPWTGSAETANAIFQGRYVFAGERHDSLNEPPWDVTAGSPWLEGLHGFDWLRDFRATAAESGRLRARELARSWIARHGTWQQTVWRPDILATRLIAWACHGDFILDGADPSFRRAFFRSFSVQARHLSRATAGTRPGLPLLTALAGRIVSGIALGESSRRLATQIVDFGKELDCQVLPDGGHVTRNPEAALEALRLVRLVEAVLSETDQAPTSAIVRAGAVLPAALAVLRHADGGLAQFNGGSTCNPGWIDSLAGSSARTDAGPRAMPDSGFQRLAGGDSVAILDAGASPAAPYDDDAHAGIASFEYAVGKERIVVNCGASRSGPWRQAGRATAAHSTLVIEDTNSVGLGEPWGIVRRSGDVRVSRNDADGATVVELSHDGYAAPFGLTHRRALYLSADGSTLRGEDVLVATSEFVPSRHRFSVRFHLHPSVKASLVGDGRSVLLRPRRGPGLRFRAGMAPSLEESVYLGTPGDVRRAEQIVLNGETDDTGGATAKWAFAPLTD
jgi:uncharacterized heparinase superfamily protein